MSSKRGSAGESRMPNPQRNPTRSASSAGLAAPPSSPLPPQETESMTALFLPPRPISSPGEDFFFFFLDRVFVCLLFGGRGKVEKKKRR